MKTLDVITFGEAMGMFIADEVGPLYKVKRFTRGLAGAETNVAVGLARLGYDVCWVSKVGEDALGEYIKYALQQEGVDISYIGSDPNHPTGFQMKSKVLAGDPQVQYFRKHSAASTIGVDYLLPERFLSAAHLHMTGIPPALSPSMYGFAEKALSVMKSANRTVSFDPNLRPKLWSSQDRMVREINKFAVQADWVLPGISEGKILTGYDSPEDIAAFYLEQGVKVVVVKLGAEGAYYRTAEIEGCIPGFKVAKVVDTVGAGDGFAVGFVSGMLDGLTIEEAVTRANAIGALAVMSPGDSDGLPSKAQLEAFMDEQKGMEPCSY
ncbi:sugar kinase [Paenibacillus naphthalenovorans]|uniref:sugar kinase n=1 Tax=Paenibacillus naphthalenovorans TaxID=162209 RepID=UPI00088F9A47|nr:sugar kinase [Paenibacillus naphthalenovorans]SDI67871.1 2-dehydro-3-deoxygluconokinase [Paenibacillus naphthalenovorans]